ncbi:MAG TPA: helix-turn-helix domain-containing protein [Ktedonobacterales bacterium]|jgi:HTH-type transcriptional regulator/antitoxin HigA
MTQAQQKTLPTLEALRDAWGAWQSLIGVDRIQSEEEYDHVVAILDIVLDETRDTPGHPLEGAMVYLGDLVEAYDKEHYNWPPPPPADMLRYLMEQQGLKQEDLADCAPQHRISEILSGKRTISKAIAKKLARRFGVHADMFL